MRDFKRPKVISSKCIEFEACRWNGDIIKSDFVRKLKDYVDFHPVCPEVEIGLGIPRDPIRVIEIDNQLRLYQPSTQRNLTDKMEAFSEDFLSNTNVDGFLLKNRSPSCGIKAVRVYHGYGNGRSKNRYGFFGGAVLRKFPHLAVEDEGRLRNLRIREDFLTRLYTLASFRNIRESGNLNELINFHTNNKFLLMAHNQESLKKMGQIIANQENLNFKELINAYETIFVETMEKEANISSNINVLLHILGYFKNKISHEEKKFFLDAVEKYRNEIYPLLVCQNILKSWIIRFEIEYLKNQTFFEPYPEELIEITTIYE